MGKSVDTVNNFFNNSQKVQIEQDIVGYFVEEHKSCTHKKNVNKVRYCG